MKKTLHLASSIALGVSLMGVSAMFAAGAFPSGTVSATDADVSANVTPCVFVSSSPEDGSTVDKLGVIQTVWDGEETDFGMDALNSRDGVYLTDDATGEIVTYATMRSVPTGFQIRLDEEVTAPGSYTLTVTAGMVFAGADFDEDTFKLVPLAGSENAETQLHFTIVPAAQPCVLVSSSPEDGSTVDKLGVIQTVWDGEETDYGMDALNSRDGVYLTDDATGEIVTYATMRSVPTGFQIRLDEEVTAPGSYTLTVTAGMVFAGADFDEDTFKLVPLAGSESAETQLHFTIVPAAQPCVLVSSTPEDGSTVDKLGVIQTVWDGEETDFGMDVLNSRDGVYLTDDATGEIVTYATMRSVPTGFQIRLDEEVTAPGSYTLTVTAGMVFAGADFDEDTFKLVPLAGSESAETQLHFTVVPAVQPCVFVSSTPEDGSTVDKLEVFQTVWEGDEAADDIEALNTRDGIYLSDSTGEIVTYGTIRGVMNGFQIRLDEAVTTPGEYTLTITAGMLYSAIFDEETFEMVAIEGSENAETQLHFTIVPAAQPCVLVSSTPEDGSTVDKLEVFQTVWEGDETADDIEALNTRDGIYLSDSTGEIVTYGTIRGVMNGFQIRLDEAVTTPGEYTLTITAGMLYSAIFDEETFEMVAIEGSENAETVLYFTVSDNVGVGTIATDLQAIHYNGGQLTVAGMEQPAISVYTLSGELVAAGTSGAYDLLPGVYVVKATEQGTQVVAKIVVK